MNFFEKEYSLFELEVTRPQTRIVYAITVPLIMLSHLVFLSYIRIPVIVNAGTIVLFMYNMLWMLMDIHAGLLTTIYYTIWWGLIYVFVKSNKYAIYISLFFYIIGWLLHIFVYIDSERKRYKMLYIIKTIILYPLFITCQIGFTVNLLDSTNDKLRQYRSYYYDEYSNLTV